MEKQLMITKEEYIDWCTPMPGMVLIEKDKPGEKMGRLLLPPGARDMGAKMAGTGVIKKISPYKIEREPYDLELAKLFEEGQRVAFASHTPYDVSLPAFCTFDPEVMDKTILVIIHIADLWMLVDIPQERLDANGKD